MWDKHRRIRHESRKRAMRSAQDRAARRGATNVATDQSAPRQTEPFDTSETEPLALGANEVETEAVSDDGTPHDRAGSLAWMGLVVLTLVLGGLMLALMFMLGKPA